MATSQRTFDRFQFERTPRPVHTDFTEDGFQSTCISFDDYRSMHLEKKKLEVQRRLDTPTWALSNEKLRDVVLRYVEMQVSRHPRKTGTPEERLQRAIKGRLEHKPRLEEIIDRLSHEYVAVKNAGNNPARLKQLRIEIEGIDTTLRFLGKEHLLALGIVYRYYHRREDSVGVGLAMQCKPPHVRQVLRRLFKCAAQVAANRPVSMRINLLRGLKMNPVVVPGNKQRQCWVCGALFTPTHGSHRICTAKCKKKRQSDLAKKKYAAAKPARFFCSDECKFIGAQATKPLAVKAKPGIGQWKPSEAGAGYDNYVKFCEVVGVDPFPEDAWRMTKR